MLNLWLYIIIELPLIALCSRKHSLGMQGVNGHLPGKMLIHVHKGVCTIVIYCCPKFNYCDSSGECHVLHIGVIPQPLTIGLLARTAAGVYNLHKVCMLHLCSVVAPPSVINHLAPHIHLTVPELSLHYFLCPFHVQYKNICAIYTT